MDGVGAKEGAEGRQLDIEVCRDIGLKYERDFGLWAGHT